MRIQIKVVVKAQDDIDVEAMRPDYVMVVNSFDRAIETIGKIQRAQEKVEHGDTAAQMDDNSDVEADPLVIEKDY